MPKPKTEAELGRLLESLWLAQEMTEDVREGNNRTMRRVDQEHAARWLPREMATEMAELLLNEGR